MLILLIGIVFEGNIRFIKNIYLRNLTKLLKELYFMSIRKRVSVNIFGSEYTIIGESPEEYIKVLAEKIDEAMKEIGSKNKRYSTTMVAVLTALNIADALYKTEEELKILTEEYEGIKEEYEIPIEQLNDVNQELEVLREHYKITQEEYTSTQIEMGKINREHKKYEEEVKDLRCELDVSRVTIKELQNKLFENQIELLKAKKELDELKLFKNKSNKSSKG